MPPRSANPGAPKEAVDWFKKRVPLTKDEWLELDERMQEKAFTIAGVAQLDMISEVQDAISQALLKGETLEAFKKRVGDSLENAWGEERPWHLEVIFRNATQRAYQAGRRAQLMEGDTLKLRPYLKAEPIMDGRTSEFCRPLFGVVLPASDRYWDTHWPPLHHNCRTSIRSLTEEQAAEAGVTKKAPKLEPDEGFGSVDPLEWAPDLTLYPPSLVQIYKRGQ